MDDGKLLMEARWKTVFLRVDISGLARVEDREPLWDCGEECFANAS